MKKANLKKKKQVSGNKHSQKRTPKGASKGTLNGSQKVNKKPKKGAQKRTLKGSKRGNHPPNTTTLNSGGTTTASPTTKRSSTKGSSTNGAKREGKLEYKKRLNKLYSNLLMNNKDKEKSREAIQVILKELTVNLWQDSRRRTVSRLLQACLKYGDPPTRLEIFSRLKPDITPSDLNSSSSKLLIKLFHYCDPSVKTFLSTLLFTGKSSHLLFSRFSADVMDVVYVRMRNREQLNVLKGYSLSNSFYLNDEDVERSKDVGTIRQLVDLILGCRSTESCREKLNSVIVKLVEKQLLTSALSHDLLFTYLHIIEDKTELVESVYKLYGQLLSTRNGNSSLLLLLDYSSNKVKKYLVKHLKRDFPEAVFNQINVQLLIKLLNVTDDTKLSGEYLLLPLVDRLEEVLRDKSGGKLLLDILDNKYELARNCLKDPKVRVRELQAVVVPPLRALFKRVDLAPILEDKNANQILLHLLRVSRDEQIVERLMGLFRDNLESLLEDTTILRFYQSLVKVNGRLSTSLGGLGIGNTLWAIVKPQVNRLLSTRAVFLLIDLHDSFKSTGSKSEGGSLEDFKRVVNVKLVEEVRGSYKGTSTTTTTTTFR